MSKDTSQLPELPAGTLGGDELVEVIDPRDGRYQLPIHRFGLGGTEQQKADFRDSIVVSDEFLPPIRPTLDLDFINSGTVDPRITFTRASTTTFYDGKTFAKAEENLLLNSATLSTQNVTTIAQPYTLSFQGMGTVTLSGTSTAGPLVGTGVNDRVTLTFTPTGGTLTLTVTGTVTNAQLEQRNAVTAYTATTAQPITRYQPQLLTAPVNSPAIDHGPVTGARLGLRIQEARTNLVFPSTYPATGYGFLFNTTMSVNTLVSPDGTISATTQTITGANAVAMRDVSIASSTAYTLSVYLKAGSLSIVRVGVGSNASVAGFVGVFDLGTITATGNATTGGVYSSSSVTPVGNGWFRCTVSGTTGTSPTRIYSEAVTGGSSGDFHIWGAQLEAGTSASSYIPTTTAQVTRAADSATITGANFSSWYRQDEGTLFTSMNATGVVGNRFNGVFLYGSPESSFIGVEQADVTRARTFTQGFVLQANIPLSSSPTDSRVAIGYKTNDIAACQNGSNVLTDPTAELPYPVTMRIGWNGVAGQGAVGYIRRITYYPARLSNNTLQAITRQGE